MSKNTEMENLVVHALRPDSKRRMSGAYAFAETLAKHLADKGFPYPNGAVGLMDSCTEWGGRISKLAHKWWAGGQLTLATFVDMAFNGWFQECEILWISGVVPEWLKRGSLSDTKYVMWLVSQHERNPDDHGTVTWFQREWMNYAGKWLEKQKAEKKAKDKHRGLLAKTRLVRLRLNDIDYIFNRIDECVEPDGEPGFRSRVRACLLGSKEAALEGIREDK